MHQTARLNIDVRCTPWAPAGGGRKAMCWTASRGMHTAPGIAGIAGISGIVGCKKTGHPAGGQGRKTTSTESCVRDSLGA
jgi:hypothetical protein